MAKLRRLIVRVTRAWRKTMLDLYGQTTASVTGRTQWPSAR